MNNEDNKQEEKKMESAEIYAAKLSFIGSALSTLGDGLQTLAAAIALQELIHAENDSQTSDQASQLEQMQIQLDYLTKKIKNMERTNYGQF
ncbi:translation initiation factor 2 [Sporosarcina cascadiensis]|uniref:translation initiation factor 2 n=1 Tax=Sporosarcina cascadiensis TaxID=2660747 RepID=UPI001E57479D|nr:translation initiation factor 2 [Sporosarcina cascadiensis]